MASIVWPPRPPSPAHTAHPTRPSSEAQFSHQGLRRASVHGVPEPRPIQQALDSWGRPALVQAQPYSPSECEQAPSLLQASVSSLSTPVLRTRVCDLEVLGLLESKRGRQCTQAGAIGSLLPGSRAHLVWDWGVTQPLWASQSPAWVPQEPSPHQYLPEKLENQLPSELCLGTSGGAI